MNNINRMLITVSLVFAATCASAFCVSNGLNENSIYVTTPDTGSVFNGNSREITDYDHKECFGDTWEFHEGALQEYVITAEQPPFLFGATYIICAGAVPTDRHIHVRENENGAYCIFEPAFQT